MCKKTDDRRLATKLNLSTPGYPSNGGTQWSKPPYSGTGFTQGMGIDMYIENGFNFKNGDVIKIYDASGNLTHTLTFYREAGETKGSFMLENGDGDLGTLLNLIK